MTRAAYAHTAHATHAPPLVDPEVIRIRPDQVERIPPEQDPYYRQAAPAAAAAPMPPPVVSLWQALRRRVALAIGGPLVAPQAPVPAPPTLRGGYAAPQASQGPSTTAPNVLVVPTGYLFAAAAGAAMAGLAAVVVTALRQAGTKAPRRRRAKRRRDRRRGAPRPRPSRAKVKAPPPPVDPFFIPLEGFEA